MRIRSGFLLSIALGSAVGILAALLFATQQWSAYQAARASRQDVLLLTSELSITETMNIERAFINARLIAPKIATTEQMAPVRQQTALVDATFAQALDLAATEADTAALQTLHASLLDIRLRALAAAARPQAARSAHLVAAYLQDMFAVQEAAYAFATIIHERINATNPRAGQATRLALLAWDLRDWSGRQTTTLISYIGEHLPMAGEPAETLAAFSGRIETKWRAARAYATTLNNPDVMAALTQVEHGFWQRGGEAYATQVVPNRGRILNIDPDAFVAAIRPILDTILPLRDSALIAALHECDADIDRRQTRFLLALGLLLLTGCTALLATHWFDRRVVRPVERITAIILTLASGHRDVEVPLQGRTDELGKMAQAIETLRRAAVHG